MSCDLAIIGNLTIDSISIDNKISSVEVGGTSAYASLAASIFSKNVNIVSKIGRDFPRDFLSVLQKKGVNTNGVKISHCETTKFRIKYTGNMRKLKLEQLCEEIKLEDLSSLKADVVHLGPVFGEVSPELIEKSLKIGSVVTIDAQGFVRTADKYGYIVNKFPIPHHFLKFIGVLKGSASELKTALKSKTVREILAKSEKAGVCMTLITRGAQGAILYSNNRVYKFPAYSTAVIDPTGAGDSLIGSFLALLVKGEDPVWCTAVGLATASFCVEDMGTKQLISARRKDVDDRAERLYNAYKLISFS